MVVSGRRCICSPHTKCSINYIIRHHPSVLSACSPGNLAHISHSSVMSRMSPTSGNTYEERKGRGVVWNSSHYLFNNNIYHNNFSLQAKWSLCTFSPLSSPLLWSPRVQPGGAGDGEGIRPADECLGTGAELERVGGFS